MKITGHVGVYEVIEAFYYFDLYIEQGEVLVCGIVADPRIQGQIWKGFHLDSEDCEHFNKRDSILNPGYFSKFNRNQMYLDWSKLKRI